MALSYGKVSFSLLNKLHMSHKHYIRLIVHMNITTHYGKLEWAARPDLDTHLTEFLQISSIPKKDMSTYKAWDHMACICIPHSLSSYGS